VKRYFFSALFLLTTLVFGKNMWETHGHNFSYSPFGSGEQKVMFPVAWDVRSANGLLNTWLRLYSPSLANPVYAILRESMENGFNTAVVRAELTDKWFPEQPGAYGDKFFPIACQLRNMGLNVIAGGIRTSLDENDHNQSVIDYLKLYIPLTAGDFAGDIIGIFAFDEPDVKYLENPSQADQWVELVSYWNEVCRSELDLPVLCYFAKFADATPDGQMSYYADTTRILHRMARFTDMVGMDMYPVKNNFRRTDLLQTSDEEPVFVAATDLVQTDQEQIQAMNSRDELIRVFAAGDSAQIVVDDIVWDGVDLGLETHWTGELPFLPDEMSSSDFRAGFAAYSGTGYVNSAVVLWQHSQPVDQAVVVVSDHGEPAFRTLPEFPECNTMMPLFFSVGQTDYWSDLDDAEGIIGHGRLAVLAGMEDQTGTRYMMLFTASTAEPNDLEAVFQQPVKLFFMAETAFWGTFWGAWYEAGTTQTLAHNGFVIADECGNYVTLNQINRDYWQLFPGYGAIQYSNLFGFEGMPDMVRVSRADGIYPPFFSGVDFLAGWFQNEEMLVTAGSDFQGGELNRCDSVHVQELPSEITGFDLLRNDHRYADRPVFSVENGDLYIATVGMDTGISNGQLTVKPENYCSGDTLITGIRAMHTRDAIRSVIAPSDGGYYIPQCELYSDKVDQWRFQWYPEAQQVGLSLGIQQTSRENALFAVVQSFGRHGFALPTYCMSPDTMLYLVSVPIVAGARGLVFYALDMSMMSGNGGDDGVSRAPFVLQNWGPSRDTQNVDMVGIVHGAVASLTGNGDSDTDYLSALVDSTWTVLDRNEAYNRTSADTLLNFIALRNSTSDTILVIAVNESTSETPFDPGIVFSTLPVATEIVSSEGFVPALVNPAGSSGIELDYSAMPGVAASLVTLATDGSGQQGSGWVLNSGTSSGGITSIMFSVPPNEVAELSIYDLAGRRIASLWQGTGNGSLVHTSLSKGVYPAGLYFVTLTGDHTLLAGKCFLW